jgi:hypothetical protein
VELLKFNQLVRGFAPPYCGLWRVLALIPRDQEAVLAHVPPELTTPAEVTNVVNFRAMKLRLARISYATFDALEREQQLVGIHVAHEPQLAKASDQLSIAQQSIVSRRSSIMSEFLIPDELSRNLELNRGFGPMVMRALAKDTTCSKVSVYEWIRRLIVFGVNASSLNPRFDRCGAPSVTRPYGPSKKKAGRKPLSEKLGGPQLGGRGIDAREGDQVVAFAKTIMKPGAPFSRIYEQIINEFWTREVQWVGGRSQVILPPPGQYPTRRQVRYLLEREMSAIDRLMHRTTPGHFRRNMRGLLGTARDGVAGPGHVYAIDSTIGDIYLRSVFNRQWIVGRPLVYFLVDVWSGAIVGFSVCLMSPSWSAAKVSLFNAVASPEMKAAIWGFPWESTLDPAPTLPSRFICDRGEYLSAGAAETARMLGFGCEYNPAYRPDLKGIVEVHNKLAKDGQYGLIPGAIDARRKEIELRPDAKLSVLTLREYCQYLHLYIERKRATGNREASAPGEMLAAGFDPTPSGMWSYGHAIGAGYRASHTDEQLIRNLLPTKTLRLTARGLTLGNLRWASDKVALDDFAAIARNYGAIELEGHHVPSSVKSMWVQLPGLALERFDLAPNSQAPAEASFAEFADLLAYNTIQRRDRQHHHLKLQIEQLLETQGLVRMAEEATKAAGALNLSNQMANTPPALNQQGSESDAPAAVPVEDRITMLIDELLSESN